MKKKKILIFFISIICLLLVVVLGLYFKWQQYNSAVWEPLINITKNAECDPVDCGLHRNFPDELQVDYQKDSMILYLDVPTAFKYGGYASASYTPDPGDGKPAIITHCYIGSNFNDIKWILVVGNQNGTNTYSNAYEAVINPDTLSVLEEIYIAEDGDYISNNRAQIEKNISMLRELYSPYLK
ncbi:MAG: hypothetical protein PUD72_07755 [Oscillospiraceae bacterium]|nr:hypothetical protein [Oscillospiraceae bacterium]